MASNSAILASISSCTGQASYAENIAPRLLTYAQQQDWVGRLVLYSGVGAGAVTRSFLNRQFSTILVEEDGETQESLRDSLTESSGVTVHTGALRNLSELKLVDRPEMVMTIGRMNEVSNLREFEPVFKGVYDLLAAGKFFIFDLYTLQGLTELGQAQDEMICDLPNLMVFRRSAYDFERQICTLTYQVLRGEDGVWRRETATDTLRGYPVQAVATLARRQGFEILGVVDGALREFDLNEINQPRVFFVLKKI